MLRLPDHWVWDFWHCHDGERHHLFYLKAPRSLGDPDLRHWNVTIGHAVSDDLVTWDERPDALRPGPPGSWDDFTTWTGSITGGPGGWSMFYTGTSHREEGLVQRIGLARSADLDTWEKHEGNPVVVTDPRWYELLDLTVWHDEAWRDPWVMPHPDGGYVMLLTARAATGPPDRRGVIGVATSSDLVEWEVHPPLRCPRLTGQMEIPQAASIGGRWYLLYSGHLEGYAAAGTFVLSAEHVLGPYLVQQEAPALVEAPWYGARIVRDGARLVVLAWKMHDESGEFAGIIGDPRPLRRSGDVLSVDAGGD